MRTGVHLPDACLCGKVEENRLETMQFVPVLVVGFAAAMGLTPLSRQIAMRLGVVDKPNQRKIHTDHKPLMGGLAIYLGFALALLLFSPPRHVVQLGAVLAGATLLATVGLLDDRYNLGVRMRMAAMTAAAFGVVAAGIHIPLTGFAPLDYAITVVWIVAITNALNFLDNMDGLSAGLAAISAFFFLLIALIQALSLVSILAAALFGSAVGFLVYNFNPASTFMGDMGALVLGFVLSVLAIKVDYILPPLDAHWFVPILALMVPIFDINLVVFTRLYERRSPWEAGKDHTSHRLLSLGLSQRHVLAVMYAAAVFFGLVALALTEVPASTGWIVVAMAAILITLFYAVMIYIRQKKVKR